MSRPRGFVPLAVAAVLFFVAPLVGLLARVPWSRLPEIVSEPVVVEALRLSLVTSVGSTVLAAVLGLPLAWMLARIEFPGSAVVRSVVLLPLVLPPVVAGVALLFAFGRRGVVGEALESVGLVLPFSTWGVIVAATFVAMPFLVLTVESALRAMDRGPEDAARTLGAGPWTILRRITVPAIRPALVAGLVLCWARAIGEFGATITFAGSLAGRTRTLPLAVFVALEADRDAAIAISLVMVAIALGVLVALRRRWVSVL